MIIWSCIVLHFVKNHALLFNDNSTCVRQAMNFLETWRIFPVDKLFTNPGTQLLSWSMWIMQLFSNYHNITSSTGRIHIVETKSSCSSGIINSSFGRLGMVGSLSFSTHRAFAYDPFNFRPYLWYPRDPEGKLRN